METSFSKQDISTFKAIVAGFSNKRDQYGAGLSPYEMFLVSVSAVNWYPTGERKMTVLTYHENDMQTYCARFLDKDFPLAYETFAELTKPTIGDEAKRKHRWIRDRFTPRCFWDALYEVAK